MKRTIRMFAAASLALAVAATSVFAAPNDYGFEPVSVNIRKADGSELAVRLLHKPTGKPVEGAVLLRTRLDMSPDNMEGMTANHAALPLSEPGVYKFRADLTMVGGWALRLVAKVPGEAEMVHGTVVFRAK